MQTFVANMAKSTRSMRAIFRVCKQNLGNGLTLDIASPGLLQSVAFCPVYFDEAKVGAGLYAKAENGYLVLVVDLGREFEQQLNAIDAKPGNLYLSPEISISGLSVSASGFRVSSGTFERLKLMESKEFSDGEKMQMLSIADMDNYK